MFKDRRRLILIGDLAAIFVKSCRDLCNLSALACHFSAGRGRSVTASSMGPGFYSTLYYNTFSSISGGGSRISGRGFMIFLWPCSLASTGRAGLWFCGFYVQEHPEAQPAVVLVLKRLRRRGHGLKSHPTDWEMPGIEPATPGLQDTFIKGWGFTLPILCPFLNISLRPNYFIFIG